MEINQNQKSSHVLPIIIMFALFFMIAFVTGFQNPMGVIVKNQFNLSNFQSQLGNFANFIAYAFMGVPAGLILQKKGYKVASLTAVVFGIVGVALMFFATLPDPTDTTMIYTLYIIGAFVAGFSMCTLNTVVNPMLNTLGGGGKRGNMLLQFGGSCNSVGATIAPILVGYLIGGQVEKASLVDARAALYVALAIFIIAFIVLFLSKLPEPILDEIAESGEQEKVKMSGAFHFPNFVFGIIAIFVYVGVEVGVANFLNLYLTKPLVVNGAIVEGLKMSPAIAGTIVGAYWLCMFFGRIIGGSVGSFVTPKSMLVTVTAVCTVLLLCGIYLPNTMLSIFGTQVPLNAVFFVLCGLCTSVMWGGIFNIATEGMGKYTAVASGIFMVMVCGGGILPLLQGAVADAVSSYLLGYWVLVVSVVYIMIYALCSKSKAMETEAE